ncbi:MAG: sporulation protein YqfD [Oscillospiraceae bacterium]|nr:sporulation protein YqfD [Oscillospiraceae bacterium]
MLFLNMLRWLRGTVGFIITGAFPERLITSCQRKGIAVWGAKRKNDSIEAKTYAANYKKLRPIAKSDSLRIRLTEKRGLFLYKRRFLRRKGLVLGAITAVILLIFASNRIWRIEVSGCDEQMAEEIISELADAGIKRGIRRKSIDARTAQRKMRLNDDRLAWIALNIVGSTLYVQLSELEPVPELIDPDDRVANIIAECDGQIKYLEIYDGKAMVQVGETVSRGDLIVSGIMEDQYGKKQFKFARAKVMAQCYDKTSVIVSLSQPIWEICGEPKKEYSLRINGEWRRLFGKAPDAACKVTEEIKKHQLFEIAIREYTPVLLKKSELTEREAKEMAIKLLTKNESGGEKVISRQREGHIQGENYILTELKLVEKDIAKTSEIMWVRENES